MIQEWWLQVGLSTERLELLKNSTVHKVDFECELGGFKNGHSAELFVLMFRLPTRPTLPQDQQQPEAAMWHLSRPVRITFTAHETQHETKCVTSVRYHSSFFTCKFVLILTLSTSSCRAEVWLVFSAASGWHAGCCSSVTLTGNSSVFKFKAEPW